MVPNQKKSRTTAEVAHLLSQVDEIWENKTENPSSPYPRALLLKKKKIANKARLGGAKWS
jgi:hypothetical protein